MINEIAKHHLAAVKQHGEGVAISARGFRPPGIDPASIQAVILAAGRGSRLNGAIANQPKCLADIGGRPLIEHQLAMLGRAGIRRVAVVTGYRARAVRDAVGNQAQFFHNAAWARTNSLYSLHLCREWVTGALLVMNCDVLPQLAVLERLLQSSGNAFAYDSSSGTDAEHMKVELDGEYLDAIGKRMVAERSQGENVGILYFEKRAARLLFREAAALIAARKHRAWLAAAVQEVARYVALRAVDVADLAWIEIDFPEDLDRARRVIWPRISGCAGAPPRGGAICGSISMSRVLPIHTPASGRRPAPPRRGARGPLTLYGRCVAVVRGLGPYTRGHWRWFALGACAAMGVVGARLVLPWPLRVVADRWLPDEDTSNSLLLSVFPAAFDPVLAMGMFFFVLIFVLGLSDFLERFYFARFAIETVRTIRNAAFAVVRNRAANDEARSDLVSRLVDDTARIKTGMQGFLVRVATNGTVYLGMTIVLFHIDAGLGAIVAAAGAATLLVTVWAAARTFENSLLQRANESLLAREIDAALRDGREDARPLAANDGVFEATQTKLQGIATWTTHAIFGGTIVAALSVGALAVDAGRIAAGDMVVFMMYALMMRGPIVRLARQGCRTGKALGTGYRLVQLFAFDARACSEPLTAQTRTGSRQ